MEIGPTWYRRPLPELLIPFSSDTGRALFREALEAGHLETFFPLIEQFHTQSDPAFCGLASLVMSLNALGVDPGRVWRGSWRWFSEELLDCCTPLSRVQATGVSMEEVACLARCNGADVEIARPGAQSLEGLRAAAVGVTRSTDRVLIASYSRSALGQTGAGHFSPIGGYHPGRDLALLLDVARFKYPPHWVPLAALFAAMQDTDPVTTRPRGWLTLVKRELPSAIAHFLICADGLATKDVLERTLALSQSYVRERAPASLEALLSASADALRASGILERVRFRAPQTVDQRRVLDELHALFAALPLYRRAAHQLGPEDATPVVLWCLAAPPRAWEALPAALAAEVLELCDPRRLPARIGREVQLMQSQVEFLFEHAAPPSATALAAS